MTRIIAATILALTLSAGIASADPLKDAARAGSIVTTTGILGAAW
jgi:hypothetical protein